ncbi:MAG TPA: LptE family protein [bacterium]
MIKRPQETQDHVICRNRQRIQKFIGHIAVYCLLSTVYCLLSSCCGYTTRSLLPGYMKKVNIKLFDNQTIKAGLDELATLAVNDAFRSGSGLRIVDEKQADLVIEGSVTGYDKEPYIYTGSTSVSQYKITVRFSVRCIDQITNDVFWEGEVSEWTICENNEDEGIRDAMRKTADRLVTAILTNW